MSWFSRLKNTLHSRPIEASLDGEIRDHLERRAAALCAAGMDSRDAEREALRAFGSVRRVREDSRDVRTWPALEATLQDLRYGWRGLRRNRAFSITALMSLGLSIGAITAVYAVVDAATFRPLPVPQPQKLFTLTAPMESPQVGDAGQDSDTFSYPAFQQVRDGAAGAAQVAIVSAVERVEAQSPDRAAPIERLMQQYVSGTAFDTIGVRPALGRIFSSDDDNGPGIDRVAVLSFDYWRRRFGSDPTVVDRSIVVNGSRYRVVGVAEQGFFGVEPGKVVDLWLPVMTFDPGVFTNPSARLFRIIGRLNAGESREQLQARLRPVVTGARVVNGSNGFASFRRAFARPVAIIGIVAASILLIAVANVASLLMGRATARAGEMALRGSLGAGRSRLVRQWLTESALLSALAGTVGWLLAAFAAPWLTTLLSKTSDPVHLALSMNTRALWFCIAVSATCTMLFGVIPALHATSMPIRGLRRVAGHSAPLRVSRIFVGMQMAFAFCLVTVACTFLVSALNLSSVDTGFDANRLTVLTLRSELGLGQDVLRMTQVLQAQVGRLTGVESAAVAWRAIFDAGPRLDAVVVPGKRPLPRQEIFYRVSPGYFATLKTPLLAGRDLDSNDTEAREPIATVVNRAFARTYFDDDHVLGRVFQRADGAHHVVVGLAGDAFYENLRGGLQPIAYFPMKPPRIFTLYIRSALDPATVMKLVEREAAAVTPGFRVVDVTTLNTLVGNTLVTERLLARLGSAFALIGLALAAIGAFGVVNYTVLQRTTEIGIRAVLGASPRALVELVVRDFIGTVVIALSVGFVAAVGATVVVRSQLFGVTALDPIVVVTALGVFLLATAVAVCVPVLRAATIDPMIAVRASSGH